MVLAFVFVDGILICNHTNESYYALLSYVALLICFFVVVVVFSQKDILGICHFLEVRSQNMLRAHLDIRKQGGN